MVINAGFGMYNDLQDALGYRTDQNAPFNPTYSLPNAKLNALPIVTSAKPAATAKLVPGGVQPDLQTPTLVSWSFKMQQELTANTSVSAGYVGSHGYDELIGVDANEPIPCHLSRFSLSCEVPQDLSRRSREYAGACRQLLCADRCSSKSNTGKYLDLFLRRR